MLARDGFHLMQQVPSFSAVGPCIARFHLAQVLVPSIDAHLVLGGHLPSGNTII
jgi:hypothetical protein